MPTPIVFIHGMFVTPRCWKPWIERFTAAGHDCLAPAWPLHDAAPEELRRRHPDAALGALGIPDLLADLTRVIAGCPRPPVLVGHSLGGLLVQLLLQKGLGAAGVAIDSAPPKGVVPFSWSFIRSNWPVVNPFVAESEPFLMSFEQFQYAFVHTLPEAAQREAYESQVVPESRKVGRGTLSDAAAIDFRLPETPALHRRHRGPHHPGQPEPLEPREVHRPELRARVSGVRRPHALHHRPGRLDRGRRRRRVVHRPARAVIGRPATPPRCPLPQR